MLLKALNHPNIVSLESMHMDIKARLVCWMCWLHRQLPRRQTLGGTSAKPWGWQYVARVVILPALPGTPTRLLIKLTLTFRMGLCMGAGAVAAPGV